MFFFYTYIYILCLNTGKVCVGKESVLGDEESAERHLAPPSSESANIIN